MVKQVPNESGIKGWIELGCGKEIAQGIPFLILGTVFLGMPAAAVIAAKYSSSLIDWQSFDLIIALSIVLLSIVINLQGVKLGSKNQKIVAFALCGLAITLIAMSTPAAIDRISHYSFESNYGDIVSGAVVAFWAFAGFENMSFMAGEFKKPKRSSFINCTVSINMCSYLYVINLELYIISL